MTRTSDEKLLERIVPDLLTYLKQGHINEGFIEEKLKYDGIKTVQDLETIFKIHFVLKDKVVKFLKDLPERVRRIKTECVKRTITRKGEVRGKIDWKRTTTKQITDKTIFVCQNPSKNYDVPENLVLKKLLSVIYKVLDNELTEPLEEDYEWLGDLKGEKDLVNSLKNIYKRNVHVNRIKDPKEYNVSERDISRAENSRKQLYREAAELLIKYRKLMRGDYVEEDIDELLKETLIIPDKTSTLFELYSIFQLIKKSKEDFQLKKIDKGHKEIAIFEKDEHEIFVYHDSTGSKKMSFFESLEGLREGNSDIEFLERYRKATVEHADLIKNLLDRNDPSFYSGRPDILIEYYEDTDLTKLMIGEVKYSTSEQTFSQGLKELVQYLYFAQEKGKYLLDVEEGESDLEGLLVVDKKEYLEEDKLEENKIMDDSLPFKIEIYDTEDLKGV